MVCCAKTFSAQSTGNKRNIADHPKTNKRISAYWFAQTLLNRAFSTWHSSCYSSGRLRFGALHKNNYEGPFDG